MTLKLVTIATILSYVQATYEMNTDCSCQFSSTCDSNSYNGPSYCSSNTFETTNCCLTPSILDAFPAWTSIQSWCSQIENNAISDGSYYVFCVDSYPVNANTFSQFATAGGASVNGDPTQLSGTRPDPNGFFAVFFLYLTM